MANKLTPPPPTGTVLDRWLALLYQNLTAAGQILWASVGKSGSNLTDLETRSHSALQNLTADDHTIYVKADGSRNITGPQLVTVNSASNALEIRQIGSGNALYIEDSANPDATPVVVTGAGLLLVGLTTPLTASGAVQASVFGSTLSSYVSNSQSTATRVHYKMSVLDAEVAGIGTSNTTLIIQTGGVTRFTLTAAGDAAFYNRTTFGSVARTSSTALGITTPASILSSNATVTDGITAESGTVTHGTINSFDNPAVAASNASVTYTNLSTVYIDGAPTAGTNVTITNPYALYVNSGASKFGGTIEANGYTVATLPAAGAAGRMAYVTDALAPAYLTALVGGGAVVCPAFDNGVAWVAH